MPCDMDLGRRICRVRTALYLRTSTTWKLGSWTPRGEKKSYAAEEHESGRSGTREAST